MPKYKFGWLAWGSFVIEADSLELAKKKYYNSEEYPLIKVFEESIDEIDLHLEDIHIETLGGNYTIIEVVEPETDEERRVRLRNY